MENEAKAVPLVELLRQVPEDARLVIDWPPDKGIGTSYIPVGRYCHDAAALLSHPVQELRAQMVQMDANVEDVTLLPDGSGFFSASFPLPKDHWLTKEGYNVPPMPWRIGLSSERDDLANKIRAAAKYAIRASTMNGKEEDFDPDAMVQNMVVGMLGYWTEDGFSSDDWANP